METSAATLRTQDRLDALTGPAAPALVRDEGGGAVRCLACGHRCLVKPGRRGVCRVRANHGGVLRVPRGYAAAIAVDPVEKKPFFHVLPGSGALSFGMLGCDFHCGYCQNWLTSQTLRDPAATDALREIDAAGLAALAARHDAPVVVSTYNEPLITAEWAAEVFAEVRRRGALTGFVSNGNATPEALAFLRPLVDLYKVDLKGFREETYRSLGGRLSTVTETIGRLREMGFWVEVVTLLVPGLNDGDDEVRALVRFLAGVSPDIPWHCTAFHPDYRMTDRDFTTAEMLLRAAAIGRDAGLRFVYPGNLPGRVGEHEDTRCPSCSRTLVRRRGFRVLEDLLTPAGGKCACGAAIPGVWTRPGPRPAPGTG
jgi:pyruvate formate lyase activating enzyme